MPRVVCWIVGHRRDRRRAWFDGRQWRAPCSRCRSALVRGSGVRRWRVAPSDDLTIG